MKCARRTNELKQTSERVNGLMKERGPERTTEQTKEQTGQTDGWILDERLHLAASLAEPLIN